MQLTPLVLSDAATARFSKSSERGSTVNLLEQRRRRGSIPLRLAMNVSISRDGNELGEWPEEQVRVFYREGQLLPTDHYWREGMTEWKELATFIKPPPPAPKKVASVFVVTPVQEEAIDVQPSATPQEEVEQEDIPLPEGYSPATYKRRCAARTIDMAIIWLIAIILDFPMLWTANSAFGSALPPSDPDWATQMIVETVAGYAILCVVFFVWETTCLTFGGCSIGKMFYGLRIVSLTNERRGIYRALCRAWGIYTSLWLFLLFPIIPAVRAIHLEKAFLRDGHASWDEEVMTTVVGKRIGWFRRIVAWLATTVAALFILIVFGLSRQPSH